MKGSSQFKGMLVAGLSLMLLLSACAGGGANTTATVAPVVPTPVGGFDNLTPGAASQVPFPAGATEVPSVLPGTQAPVTGVIEISPTAGAHVGIETPVSVGTAPVPNTGGTPAAVPDTNGQLLGANVNPAGARSQAVLLSNMMDYNVVDRNGQPIGKINDYILNLCELNIIYMVIDADPSLNLQGGSVLVVPYQEFTLASGVIDVNNHNLVMNIDQSNFQGAPALNQKPDLSNLDWESNVRDYWNNVVELSALSTKCQVPQGPGAAGQQATPISTVQATMRANDILLTKIAYASSVLGMQVQDGNANPVGQVQEVYLVPESGRIRYLAVDKSSAAAEWRHNRDRPDWGVKLAAGAERSGGCADADRDAGGISRRAGGEWPAGRLAADLGRRRVSVLEPVRAAVCAAARDGGGEHSDALIKKSAQAQIEFNEKRRKVNAFLLFSLNSICACALFSIPRVMSPGLRPAL